jgi:TolB protein
MTLFLRPQTYARTAGLVLLLILAALLAVAGVVGSQPDRQPAPPFGLARNGLIAFDANGDIWVADPDGSDPRALTSGPGVDIDPTWSPDGTLLAYWSLDDPNPPSDGVVEQDRIIGLLGSSGTASLMVTDEDGGPPNSLIEDVTLDPNGLLPSWSPDSESLVFGHVEDGGSVIDIVGLDRSRQRVGIGEAPTWSPDGSEIAYQERSTGVMVIGVDGGDPRQVTQAAGSGGAFSLPQWSPDGSKIAYFAGPDGAHDIWVVSVDGTDEHAVSTDFHDEYWPYWSPDGTRIAFGRTASGQTINAGNYVIADPEGIETLVLPVEPLMAGAPTTWSPDGTMLVGGLVEDGQIYRTWPVLIDASGEEPVLRVRIDGPPSPWNSFSWQRLAP